MRYAVQLVPDVDLRFRVVLCDSFFCTGVTSF